MAGRAAAQVRISSEIASDARYRGRSVSEERPTGNLDLSYDTAAGAYGGIAGAVVATSHHGLQPLTLREYVGYATRLDAGPALDLGATHVAYTEYYGGHGGTQYSEVYAGLISRRLKARLSYSPSYFGGHARTLYGEVASAVQPARNWRLSVHAGVLTRLGGPAPAGLRPTQYDWRLGLATAVRSFEVELAWSGAGPDYAPYARGDSRSALVLALRRDF